MQKENYIDYFKEDDSRREDLQDCENDAETVYCGSEAQMMNFYEALKAEVEQRKQSYEADGQNMRLKEYCKTLAPMAVLIEDGDYFSLAYRYWKRPARDWNRISKFIPALPKR